MPAPEAQARVLAALRALVPRSPSVEAETFEHVKFIDQGGNFENVECPGCGADATPDWPAWMDRAFETRFLMLALTMPCCGLATSLNALSYRWPAGFARFSVRARDPGIGGWLPSEDLATLEGFAGCKLRQIYSRY